MTAWEGLDPPYATIVADPPWSYRNTGDGVEGRVGYSTLDLNGICSLPVADLADINAHVYVWATNPLMREAFDVVEAWGFRYVTTLSWLKRGALGMGYYFRGETEHVLFGVRGKAPIPPELRVQNWFEARKEGHSVKPPVLYDIAERVSPAPRVELFARQQRFGWDSWGHGYEAAS